MAKRHSYRRRRSNPFVAGGINKLAIKVAGGLAGGIAAATVPNMLGPSLGSGWGGVVAAAAIAIGGSMVFKGSPDFSEGIIVGGSLQAAGRIAQILMGKNIVSFSLGQYAPMAFPVPTPAWQQRSPVMPASAASTKSAGAPMAPTMGRHKAYSKYVA